MFGAMLEVVAAVSGWLPSWAPVLARAVGASAFCGIAVKLMDDSLDLEIDRVSRRPNLVESLGGSVTSYALACLALAAAFDTRLALGLFFSSYSLGMGLSGRGRLPSGLPEAFESLAGIGFGTWAAGPRVMGLGLMSLAAIQLIDDLADRESDQLVYPKPWVNFLGTTGCLLLAAVLVLFSMALGPLETGAVLVVATALQLFIAYRQPPDGENRGEEGTDGGF